MTLKSRRKPLVYFLSLVLLMAVYPSYSMAELTEAKVRAILDSEQGVKSFSDPLLAADYLTYLMKGGLKRGHNDLVFTALQNPVDPAAATTRASKIAYYYALIRAISDDLYSLDVDSPDAKQRARNRFKAIESKVSEYLVSDPETGKDLLLNGLHFGKFRTINLFQSAAYRAAQEAMAQEPRNIRLLHELAQLEEHFSDSQKLALIDAKVNDETFDFKELETYKSFIERYPNISACADHSSAINGESQGSCENNKSGLKRSLSSLAQFIGAVSAKYQVSPEERAKATQEKAEAKARAAEAKEKARQEREDADAAARQAKANRKAEENWKQTEQANAQARAKEDEKLAAPRMKELKDRQLRNRMIQILNSAGLSTLLLPDAKYAEIKKAFTKAAVRLHPDKNNGQEGPFKELNSSMEAYRKIYGNVKLTWPEGDQ